jgi:hypothetical protein
MALHKRSLLYALIKEVAEEAWNEVWLEEDPLNIEEDLLDGLFEEEKPVHPVVANFEEFRRLLDDRWDRVLHNSGRGGWSSKVPLWKQYDMRVMRIYNRVQSHIVFSWRASFTRAEMKAYLKQNNIRFKSNLLHHELRALLHTF